jgi:hypothetical protein
MKILFISVAVLLIVGTESCKKTYPATDGGDPGIERTIRFQLYSEKDLSNETGVIKFSIFIRNSHKTLFDSSFASMQIKDLPDAAHKIVIEKTVSGNGNVDLAGGFSYEIENVGNSWYIDTSKAGNAFKVIDYAFQ